MIGRTIYVHYRQVCDAIAALLTLGAALLTAHFIITWARF